MEVPCLVDATGVHPVHVGELPPQLAALNRTYLNVCELTVRAVLEGRPDFVRHAAMLDPNAAATLSLDQIWELCDELTEAHGDALPESLRGTEKSEGTTNGEQSKSPHHDRGARGRGLDRPRAATTAATTRARAARPS